MTPDEFMERTGAQLFLRSFQPRRAKPSDTLAAMAQSGFGGPSDAVEGRWRATIGSHYYTSDTGRLVGAERENENHPNSTMSEIGWGNTPDEAVTNLAIMMLKNLDEARMSWRKMAAEGQEKYEAMAEKFRELAPARSGE